MAARLERGPLITVLAGTAPTRAERTRLRHPLVGGVLLRGANFASTAQFGALCTALRALRDPPLLLLVDHEGGSIQPLREGFTRIPAMRTLGRQWDRDPLDACRSATRLGLTIGRELRDIGVDLAFGPVLDIDYGRSGVIGDRALHADPRVVALLGRALTHGMLLAGMANCGKHFPGHGYCEADSHHALPVDRRPLTQILATDAAPYRWIGEALAAVMPAHVVYPRVDALPATFSRRWLRTILRGRLGFDGAVIADDLTMAGAAGAGSLLERAALALEAGCDMLIVGATDDAASLLSGLRWSPEPSFGARVARLAGRGG